MEDIPEYSPYRISSGPTIQNTQPNLPYWEEFLLLLLEYRNSVLCSHFFFFFSFHLSVSALTQRQKKFNSHFFYTCKLLHQRNVCSIFQSKLVLKDSKLLISKKSRILSARASHIWCCCPHSQINCMFL